MSDLPNIVHLDADAFFVACEQAKDPSLIGKKCAVGGTERGIISSASYEARACGVYTPMPTARAMRVCPDLIMIKHTSGLYGTVSRQMFDLCEEVTPHVQRNSIDEGYLDLEPCRLGSVEKIEAVVRKLQARIMSELKIPVSFGVATNKLVSQIASKLRKPRGFVVVMPGTEAAFLEPLPVGKLPGIGTKTEATFAEAGIHTISDVLRQSPRFLQNLVGDGWEGLLASARGEDERIVATTEEDAKSYSQQETFFTDVSDFATIEKVAKGMVDDLIAKVRTDQKRVKTVTVKVRYPDFSQESKGKSLDEPSDLAEAFYSHVSSLIRQAWTQRRPLRLVSVKLSGVEDGGGQLELFAEKAEKRRALAAVMDRLNQGKGTGVVQRGHQLTPDADAAKRKR